MKSWILESYISVFGNASMVSPLYLNSLQFFIFQRAQAFVKSTTKVPQGRKKGKCPFSSKQFPFACHFFLFCCTCYFYSFISSFSLLLLSFSLSIILRIRYGYRSDEAKSQYEVTYQLPGPNHVAIRFCFLYFIRLPTSYLFSVFVVTFHFLHLINITSQYQIPPIPCYICYK